MGVSFNWLKTGEESEKAAKQAAAEVQKRKEEQGKLFRFWLNKNEEGVRLTFVDGELNASGYLTPPRFWEHQVKLNGNWNNYFVCPEKNDPESGHKCPICSDGDSFPYLASLFTIIDHRSFESNDKTKVYKDRPKLFVAKADTFDILNKIAIKRGGLAGCAFDVMRSGDKSPSVGSMFDFIDKQPIEDLKKKYTETYKDPKTNQNTTKTVFVPADYEKEIIYRTVEELMQLGFGHGMKNISTTPKEAAKVAAGSVSEIGAGTDPDYSDHL